MGKGALARRCKASGGVAPRQAGHEAAHALATRKGVRTQKPGNPCRRGPLARVCTHQV
jgi:hypothetical protein